LKHVRVFAYIRWGICQLFLLKWFYRHRHLVCKEDFFGPSLVFTLTKKSGNLATEVLRVSVQATSSKACFCAWFGFLGVIDHRLPEKANSPF
jgi:hypothetical protein